MGGGEGGGVLTEDHAGLRGTVEAQCEELGELSTHADGFLAGVLHRGHDHDAEGAALGEDLRQQPGGLLHDLRRPVRGEHGELVDDQHVQRIPRPGLVQP